MIRPIGFAFITAFRPFCTAVAIVVTVVHAFVIAVQAPTAAFTAITAPANPATVATSGTSQDDERSIHPINDSKAGIRVSVIHPDRFRSEEHTSELQSRGHL